ncbi:hypothetical protein KBA41_00585 [Candidatus Ozemobacteraceae bacterium]|nr:hypothetical protein [Candidatus Ozemobacteraceae bacterium]
MEKKVLTRTSMRESQRTTGRRSSRSWAHRLTALFAAVLAMLLVTGCDQGNLRFNPLPTGEYYTLSGNVSLANLPVEGDLVGTGVINPSLLVMTDYSKFQLTAGEKSSWAAKDGTFTVSKVPYSTELVLEAKAGKVALRRRLFPRDLRESDTTRLSVTVETTAIALIWERAHQMGKELTEWDIATREFEPSIASVTRAIRLALQIQPSSVSGTILDLEMVKTPVLEAAQAIQPCEATLREAHRVLENAVLRENHDLIAQYVSTSFTNDWDSSAGWLDLLTRTATYFDTYDFSVASWTIVDMELMPAGKARIRIAAEAFWSDFFSGTDGSTGVYSSDVYWQREGTFWKIVRNMPYKAGDPRQLGADARWGEIAAAHVRLQAALGSENLDVLRELVSENFGNDWDAHSTFNDLIETAQARFNMCDVKIATYAVESVEFNGQDLATVHCSAQVRVIRLIPGIDIDSGPISAIITWRRENGVWKLFRNLPYRFSHPTNIR